jgi:hypothetical protein
MTADQNEIELEAFEAAETLADLASYLPPERLSAVLETLRTSLVSALADRETERQQHNLPTDDQKREAAARAQPW